MKRYGWHIILVLALLVLSVVFYLIHYAVFRDAHHIFIYLLGDIAFVFIEVLLVTLIIHQVLSIREKRARMEKLNMVIGSFFSKVGTTLLTLFSDLDPGLEKIRTELIVTSDWSEQNFSAVSNRLKQYEYAVKVDKIHIDGLREYLVGKGDFLLRLIENPNVLEHEAFTEALRALFHLTEELGARGDMSQLPPNDYAHIAGDIKRVYVLLVHQWVEYMKHLKNNYPYLFSLAVRQNPFDQSASIVVK
jgi:hypothetical protein